MYAVCVIKDDELRYNGPTHISIGNGRDGKCCAASHAEDFEKRLSLEEFKEEFKENALTEDQQFKPLVFVSVDGGPDEAPKNQ